MKTMKTIAFFNNKGGVGKTTLVYHLAWMCSELDKRVMVADLDPQSNLSVMLLGEDKLGSLWNPDEPGQKNTIESDIAPLFRGVGDIESTPHIEKVDERLGVLVGDLSLSKREDTLSGEWSKCLVGDERAFRVTTAFSRLIHSAGKQFEADLVIVDVAPNLGAINRAALISCDYVVLPLAPDLFSLQGLRNVGPQLAIWRDEWEQCKQKKPADLDIELPEGRMQPIGYVMMRRTLYLSHPVRAYARWIDRMPEEYRNNVLKNSGDNSANQVAETAPEKGSDPNCLAHLKDYHSLMPLAQEANKPMFALKPADGVFGAQQRGVSECYQDFANFAKKLLRKTGIGVEAT